MAKKAKEYFLMHKDIRVCLLQYVRNRTLVDLEKAEMDFSIYGKDIWK